MKWLVQTAFSSVRSLAAMGNECFVSGITVDASGRPVEERCFCLCASTSWESLIVTYKSIEGGEFSVPYDCDRQ